MCFMTDTLGLSGSAAESARYADEDLGRLFDEEYYRTACGPVPYTRSEPRWAAFFGTIADELIRTLRPQRVLDAGCALGFLVEAFWDRGIEARGLDISPYAISQVRRDLQPYCQVGSIADGIEGRYDLITCLEVLEHMPEAQAARAIENMTRATDTIVFSATPRTQVHARPVLSWLHLFRERGFGPDLAFDLAFVGDYATLFRRSDEPLSEEVLQLYSRFLGQRHELSAARAQVQLLESAQEEIHANLEAANRQLAGLIDSRSGRAASPGPVTLDHVTDLLKAQAAIVKSLEFRVGGVEQRSAQIAQTVTGILESCIWRTMVKGGGLIQKLFG
jgi:SAM-dependent methyltransferase